MQIYYFLIVGSILIPWLVWFFYPQSTKALLSDLRPLRILHYVSLSVLGAVLSLNQQFTSAIRKLPYPSYNHSGYAGAITHVCCGFCHPMKSICLPMHH